MKRLTKSHAETVDIATQMYPIELDGNADYEWNRDYICPPTLSDLSTDISDSLRAFGDNKRDATGFLCHAGRVVIEALQAELKRTKAVISNLRRDVSYAEAAFAEACDCGQCGPCKKSKLFRKHVDAGKLAMKRIDLTQ